MSGANLQAKGLLGSFIVICCYERIGSVFMKYACLTHVEIPRVLHKSHLVQLFDLTFIISSW